MTGTLERRAAMATLVEGRDDDLLVVPGLGSTTYDLAATSISGAPWAAPR